MSKEDRDLKSLEVEQIQGEETPSEEMATGDNNKKRSGKKRSLIGLMSAFLTWSFSALFIIVIMVVSLLFFVVDTQAGLKTVISFANKYGSDYISIGEGEGRLGRRFSLTDVELKLPNYPALKVPSIALDWDYLKLIDREVDVKSLSVTGADLDFTPIKPTPEKVDDEESAPFSLKDLNIPINASIGAIDLGESTLKINDLWLAVNDFKLEGAVLEDNDLQIKNAIGDLHLLVGDDVDVPFVIALNGGVNAPLESFDTSLAVYGQQALVNGNEFNIALNTQLEGLLNQFSFNLDGRVDWANMLNDPLLLKVQNSVTDFNEIKSYLHIKNLKNQIMLDSTWYMDKPYDFDLALKMNAPYLSQFHPKIRGSLMGDILLKGDIMKPLLTADVDIHGVDIFGLRLESLLLTGSHENYDATVSLAMNHFKYDAIYLKDFGLTLNGNLTEVFDFNLYLNDLVREINPVVEAIPTADLSASEAKRVEKGRETFEDKLDIVDRTTQKGDPNEELYFAENTPISYVPMGATELLVKNIEYKITGEAESHKFIFNLESMLGSIKSDGLAALTNLTTDPTFNLYLANSEVKSPYVGNFKLNKPAYFYFRAKDQQFTLSSVCYQQSYTVLCVEGSRSEKGVNAGVITLNNLPSSLLKEYLPKDISIDTKANTTIAGQFTTEEDFVGIVNISLSKGDIRYRLQGREVKIPLDKTLLTVQAHPNGVTSLLDVDWGKYLRVNGDGNISDLFAENKVAAKVKADIPSFDWVSPLMPVLQDLGGEVVFTSEVNGPIKNPDIGAKLSIINGKLFIASLNSRLKNINLNVDLKKGTPIFLIDGKIGTNEGTLNLDGFYNISNLSTSLNAKGENILLADSENIKVKLSPQLSFTGNGGNKPRYNLKGVVRVPELTYLHASGGSGGSVVTSSSDTIIIGDGRERLRGESFMNSLNIDVTVLLGDKILVGMDGLKAKLSGGIKVNKDYTQPIRGLGVINVGQGEFDIYGQKLTLDRGKIQFTGGVITNPALDIQASRTFVNEMEGREVQVGVKVFGAVQAPKVQLYSSPAMTDIEVASYLFLGRSPNLESPTENLMLLNMVRKIATGEPISSSDTSIASKVGLTDFGFVETPNGNTGIGLGKRFANSLYIGLGVGIEESEGAFAIFRYRFLKYFNVNTAIMSEGESINVNYLRDF